MLSCMSMLTQAHVEAKAGVQMDVLLARARQGHCSTPVDVLWRASPWSVTHGWA